jgi:HEAT repeat protein
MIMDTNVKELIDNLKGKDEKVRGQAWQNACMVGAPAVTPLADVMADDDFHVARAAKRAMWVIVRDAGRPGADQHCKAVRDQLRSLLGDDRPVAVRREILWMLSEVGCPKCTEPIAKLLADKDLREDARCTLQRIPGDESLAALKAGLAAAPDDFKLNIAQSLRARGVEVPGLPCQKLTPTKKTEVKPVGR